MVDTAVARKELGVSSAMRPAGDLSLGSEVCVIPGVREALALVSYGDTRESSEASK